MWNSIVEDPEMGRIHCNQNWVSAGGRRAGIHCRAKRDRSHKGNAKGELLLLVSRRTGRGESGFESGTVGDEAVLVSEVQAALTVLLIVPSNHLPPLRTKVTLPYGRPLYSL